MQKTFGIIPASSGVLVFLYGIGVFVLVIFGIVVFSKGFEALSVYGLITLVVFLVVFWVLASFGYQARHITFSVTEKGLRIGPGIYGRTIPLGKIDISGIRVIDLNTEKEFMPFWRMNGAGLPGYYAGWFKLHNRQKALLFVTDRSRVVYIPTINNYSVLLSVQDAEEFAGVLRRSI